MRIGPVISITGPIGVYGLGCEAAQEAVDILFLGGEAGDEADQDLVCADEIRRG
jgi:hypothetical protein